MRAKLNRKQEWESKLNLEPVLWSEGFGNPTKNLKNLLNLASLANRDINNKSSRTYVVLGKKLCAHKFNHSGK